MAVNSSGVDRPYSPGHILNQSFDPTYQVSASIPLVEDGPNSQVLRQGQTNWTTIQSAVSATGNGSTYNVSGYSSIVFDVSGTFTATINFETVQADGATWVALNTTQLGANTIASSTTSTGLFRASVGGLQKVRARVTWTSGTSVTVKVAATTVDTPPKVINALLPQLIEGEDQTKHRLWGGWKSAGGSVITADTLVTTGAGVLHTITCAPNDAAPTAGNLDVYDNTTNSGTKLFSMAFTTTYFTPFTVTLDVPYGAGLYADFTTTADVNVTISYA